MIGLVRFRLLLDRLSYWSTLICAYALLIVSLVVCADVILRKLEMSPFIGANEISGYGLALVTSWGAAFALFRGSHIRVDVFYRTCPLKVRAWLDLAAAASMLALGGLLAWRGSMILLDSWEFGAVANTPLRTPLWIPQLLWVGGLALLAISALAVLVEAVLRILQADYVGVTELMDSNQGGQEPLL